VNEVKTMRLRDLPPPATLLLWTLSATVAALLYAGLGGSPAHAATPPWPFADKPVWRGQSGGRQLALVQPDSLYMLDRAGQSWERIAVPRVGNYQNAVQIDPDGTVWLVAHTEASCGGGMQERYVRRPGQVEFVQVPFDVDVVVWALGPGGWIYAATGDGQDRHILALGPAGQRVRGPRIGEQDHLTLTTGKDGTRLSADGKVYRVDGGRLL
jgi:hypothetical protein